MLLDICLQLGIDTSVMTSGILPAIRRPTGQVQSSSLSPDSHGFFKQANLLCDQEQGAELVMRLVPLCECNW